MIAIVGCEYDFDTAGPIPGDTEVMTTHIIPLNQNETTLEYLIAADAVCGPGSYSPSGFSTCIQCETGTFSDTTLATTGCKQCVSGRYSSADGASVCLQCPSGKFSYFQGSSVCSSCPAWTGSSVGLSACVTCTNSSGCAYADGTACPMCGSVCVLCSAGYYNDGGSNRCSACGAGKYNPSRGGVSLDACMDCSVGSYTKPTSAGMSACLQCSANPSMSFPLNAGYVTGSPLLCAWVCNQGYQTVPSSPGSGSAEWDSLSSSYTSQGFSANDIVLMIQYRSDFCCDSASVSIGKWRTGCTKYSAGSVVDCLPVQNGVFVDSGVVSSLNRCGDWACNSGYFKRNNVCNPQAVCESGYTFNRDSAGQLVLQDGVASCVQCPVCVDGSETAVACNSTHSAVCRKCKQYSASGGACVVDPPLGYRGVSKTYSISLGWGVWPTLSFDNKPFVWSASVVFNSYIACDAIGVGQSFIGGDEVCDPTKSSLCSQCKTQCSPWKRTGGWFQGAGWFSGAQNCIACSYSDTCAATQFLDMSVCGPVLQPKCADCPADLKVSNQIAWANPSDEGYNGLYPCRAVCQSGYSELNDQCVQCPNLPANVFLVNGCEWKCKPGYLQNLGQCEACPAPPACGLGLYPDYTSTSNVCLSCLQCVKPSNAVFLSGGTLGGVKSCSFQCLAGSFRSQDSCTVCSQRSCLASAYLSPCTGTSDSQCLQCKLCVAGERIERACGVANNTVCSVCDSSLLPSDATWTAVGCASWDCKTGYWKDGVTCRKCSVQKDCVKGETLQVMGPACSSVSGVCVSCPSPPSGRCFNGDPYCGTTADCGIITPAVITTKKSPTTSSATTTKKSPTTSSAPSTTTTPQITVTTVQVTPPVDLPTGFATVAVLTVNDASIITAVYFVDLVGNISAVVCVDAQAVCNVSILSVTVGSVTTYCTNGVCPGYARQRALLGISGANVSVGVVTSTAIPDISDAVSRINSVTVLIIMPNAPWYRGDSFSDSRSMLDQVAKSYTVYVIIVEKASDSSLFVGIGVVLVVLVIGLIYARSKRTSVVIQLPLQVDPPSAPPALLVGPGNFKSSSSRFTALESIRITRENYKPFVKTV